MRGVHGRLVTASFARELPSALPGAAPMPGMVRRALAAWWRRCEAALGPASAARAVADVALVPLLRLLGHDPRRRADDPAACWIETGPAQSSAVGWLALDWSSSLPGAWRHAVARAIAGDARWGVCCNGRSLRIVDGRRTWTRDYLEFDLSSLAEESDAQDLLWTLASGPAMAAEPPRLDRAAALSARHGLEVCGALGDGVLQALQLLIVSLPDTHMRRDPGMLFEHSLTVLYRVLFLHFAEARGLVPVGHPLYRDRYSLDSIVTTLLAGRRYRGLWLAVQAISRLAHAGCSAGDLKVTAFNGRLFAPSRSTFFDRVRLGDDVMGRVVMAVSAAPDRGGGRSRIAYRDLDVEQLGAVYERLLDYGPAPAGAAGVLVRTGDRRKATGTFYTPRAVTAHLVRRALEPLTAGRSSQDLLRLRVLDPAMGSGAFLVAACRYLASAVEDALVREGRWHAHDVTAGDRAGLRREVASRCLYGVDSNPMAVQLARLSLWLATLSADKPLSFLDHRLVAGDSLVGATPADVRRQPTGTGTRQRRHEPLPLFADSDLATLYRHAVRTRERLAATPDDSAAVVRAKEQALAELGGERSELRRWSRALDIWCAGWFWDDGPPLDRRTFDALLDHLLNRGTTLPQSAADRLLDHAGAIAAREQFLHWTLTFPEVFLDADGMPLASGGFDAIVGNPPWDMVRGDSGDASSRGGRRREARQLTAFVRESGVYQVESRAHANRYQLFVERAVQLARAGGRIGLVLPSGMATDTGAAPLRRYLMDNAAVDGISGLDNRDGVFPIHRGLRFVLVTATAGAPTAEIRCRFGITDPEDLEKPAAGPADGPLVLTRRFLARLSGDDDLGIPEIHGSATLALLERISTTLPRLADPGGWGARFGRELNATDDRRWFAPMVPGSRRRAVVEGKQLEPFHVALGRSRLQVRDEAAVLARAPRRARLAYRDVASATNRLTLIAAIVPPAAVTTHTLFCLKTRMPMDAQHVLCALMNSYVANYLVRLRVNTHVTVALVSRLPVPVVRNGEQAFERLARLATTLAGRPAGVEGAEEYAELQAIAARLYGLTREEFEHVLETFPLVPRDVRARALEKFQGPPRH